MLRDHSQHNGHKLIDIAQAIVDSHLLLLPAARTTSRRTRPGAVAARNGRYRFSGILDGRGALTLGAARQHAAPNKRHRKESTLSKAGWSLIGRPQRSGRRCRFDPEVLMVEIRVTVTDATPIHGLMRRLGRLFDRSSVSYDGARREVRVRSEWESRSVVEVIDAVQSWLEADGLGSAKLSIGDRSYTIFGPVALPVPSGRAA